MVDFFIRHGKIEIVNDYWELFIFGILLATISYTTIVMWKGKIFDFVIFYMPIFCASIGIITKSQFCYKIIS